MFETIALILMVVLAGYLWVQLDAANNDCDRKEKELQSLRRLVAKMQRERAEERGHALYHENTPMVQPTFTHSTTRFENWPDRPMFNQRAEITKGRNWLDEFAG